MKETMTADPTILPLWTGIFHPPPLANPLHQQGERSSSSSSSSPLWTSSSYPLTGDDDAGAPMLKIPGRPIFCTGGEQRTGSNFFCRNYMGGWMERAGWGLPERPWGGGYEYSIMACLRSDPIESCSARLGMLRARIPKKLLLQYCNIAQDKKGEGPRPPPPLFLKEVWV